MFENTRRVNAFATVSLCKHKKLEIFSEQKQCCLHVDTALSHLIYFLMCRLKDVQTLEELGDVYNHFLLYYGRDIPKMQNAAKANKKRLKKIKEVSEDGKMRNEKT